MGARLNYAFCVDFTSQYFMTAVTSNLLLSFVYSRSLKTFSYDEEGGGGGGGWSGNFLLTCLITHAV